MEANTDDAGFMKGMKSLLGMDDDLVEQLLDTLDNDSLLALTDAVSKQDKDAALAIVKSFDNDVHVNSLFRGKDVQEKDQKKKPVKPPDDYVFSIGDDVAIKSTNEETGEDEYISATVFQPNAPGDTIGVKIEGKPKMVEKDEVFTLNEMVMGMVGVPNLQRIQRLAGISGQMASQEPVTIEPVQDTQPVQSPIDAVQQASSALDTLNDALPNVRLADLKIIRQRIIDMQAKMNECIAIATPAGRAKKL